MHISPEKQEQTLKLSFTTESQLISLPQKMSAPSLENEMENFVYNDPVRIEGEQQIRDERCLEHEHIKNSYESEPEVTQDKNKLLFQSSQETTEKDFVFIDTEELILTHTGDFILVDLVSNAVPPEAHSHPELVETIISNPEQERLVCVRSFPIHLEDQTVNEICVQTTEVDDWLNIDCENITKVTF